MSCIGEDELVDFVSGELGPERQAVLSAHLDGCAACRQVVAGVMRATHGAPPVERGEGEALRRGTTLGRYLVLERIGSGGMGVVYAAYDPELDRRVCLKLLRPTTEVASSEASARLVREAQAMAKLSHPNVIAVHDVGTADGQHFVAMELVEGGTLGDWLAREPRSWREVVAKFCLAGRGLLAAHTAGMVHRDFKAENVLVGTDGQVRVTDFGLVQWGAEPAEASEGALAPAQLTLTRSGALLGTPAYMAPEQLFERASSEKTDQFNFCAALYQALYGERPYPGATLEEISHSLRQGQVQPAPKGTRVPGFLRKALVRGLALRPEHRFSSMAELLTALERDPARTRRRAVLVVAAVALAGATAAVWARQRAMLCSTGLERWAGVWDSKRREEVRDAFASTKKPYAEATFAWVDEALSGYARRWVSGHRDACLATRQRQEQSEQVMELRLACLERSLRDARLTVDLLAKADAKLVERSPQLVVALPSLGECSDREALAAVVPLPADVALRAKVEELREQVAQARLRLDAAQYADAKKLAQQAISQAKTAAYKPVEAEGRYVLAQVEEKLGDSAASEQLYEETALLAEASRYDQLTAKALAAGLFVVGVRQGKLPRAEQWAARGAATLERIGGGERVVRATYEANLAALRMKQGRFDEAVALQRSSLELREAELGPEHLDTAAALSNLSGIYLTAGKLEAASLAAARALEIREKQLGPKHPLVASSVGNLAAALTGLGRFDEALELHRRALAIKEGALGPKHPALASTLANLAQVHRYRGEHRLAVELIEQSLLLAREGLGADHPAVITTENNLADLLLEQGNAVAAEAQAKLALEHARRVLGAEHAEVAVALTNQGAALVRQGRNREALVVLERARALREKLLGSEHPRLANTLVWIGRAHLAAKDDQRALPVLERALALRTRAEGPREDLAEHQFLLAQALAATDRARAVALASEALAAFRASKLSGAGAEASKIERWLLARGVAATGRDFLAGPKGRD